ncbi:MAG: helix-turn-helix domain-containing protein [Chloroflexota bacterium]|nr:helix-turn-helix domain-containing protein [Chloroflexota bacterium]
MTIATERKAPWNTLDYQRIVSVRHRAGVLTVGFADGATVTVDVDAFQERPGTRDWDLVTHTAHEIVVPREADEDDEIPWDVIRSLTDPAFERHLTDFAAESARCIGLRVRELREGARLTAHDLAERSGIPLQRLAAIEAGTDGVSLPALERLVTAMGHDMGVFVVPHEGEPDR